MLMLGIKPENKYERVIVDNIAHYVINYKIEFNNDKNLFQWNSVRVNNLIYDEIVSAIIRDKYSNDKMQAIINNHLMEPDEEHIKEFQEMQEWRKFAKSYAKELLAQ